MVTLTNQTAVCSFKRTEHELPEQLMVSEGSVALREESSSLTWKSHLETKLSISFYDFPLSLRTDT